MQCSIDNFVILIILKIVKISVLTKDLDEVKEFLIWKKLIVWESAQVADKFRSPTELLTCSLFNS